MASGNRTSRRSASRKLGGRRRNRNRTNNLTSPKSPQSILAQARRDSFTSNRNPVLFGVGSNSKIRKRADRNASGRLWKYSKSGVIPHSTDPLEKNCFLKEPMPHGYVFVAKGDVYVTRNCRAKTKESQRIVYLIYDNTGRRTIGIRVPSDIYTGVVESAAATAESRANAVKSRDAKDLAHARHVLCTQFPLMPTESLETILDHAFLKGSGRVGRTTYVPDERKAGLAVEAHIRHTHTSYEALLNAGKDREEARKAVWGMVCAIKAAWEGSGSQPMDILALRNRMVKSN
ncbi:hypothetical protein BDV25DRAFT_160298 [Aspergillus avenaceus]|uniref:DUF2293 domain-containing protein n=1 Tax=Aspergillus avenaceus TaxID=36643 RepID=A0A5N6TMA4_ASPAV|nr:hypothetical protein BDV25DRAFT_160298 [Aspergillus avenaceus]